MTTRYTEHSFIQSIIAGATAGLTVDLSLYPLDTIKTRLQSRQGFKASGGFKNFYRGMSSIALGSAPGSAFFFVIYNSTKNLLPKGDIKYPMNSHPVFDPLYDALRASLGEVAACLVRVPTELVKQRAQVSGSQKTMAIFRDICRSRGIGGLYTGYLSTVFREIPFSFIEFPIWEYLKRRCSKNGESCASLTSAVCGSVAGAFAAGVTTPLDVIKTRIMLDRSGAKASILTTIRQIVQQEGGGRLYAGVVPRSLWMGIGGFVFFLSYELALSATRVLQQ